MDISQEIKNKFMSIFSFEVNSEALKRNFSIYIVWAKNKVNNLIYIGKTGDNRYGCNPIISRCGNHFSYNNIHSQIRNKIKHHENYKYKYYFIHFDKYQDNSSNRESINKINEMERWLNQKLQFILKSEPKLSNLKIEILNPLKSMKAINKYRSKENENKLDELIKYIANDFMITKFGGEDKN